MTSFKQYKFYYKCQRKKGKIEILQNMSIQINSTQILLNNYIQENLYQFLASLQIIIIIINIIIESIHMNIKNP